MTNIKSTKPRPHGGSRSGAGRPTSNRKRRNISITDELYEFARTIGWRTNAHGNTTLDASVGIERALLFYQHHAPGATSAEPPHTG